MDFGELKDDKDVQERLRNLHSSVDKIEATLERIFDGELTRDLSLKNRMDHDIFVAYTLNTLYWMYLRSKGLDPNGNDVKKELTRVKDYMLKLKSAVERQTIRPKIVQPAAERFIKHGIGKRGNEGGRNDGDSRTPKRTRLS